MKKQAFNPYLPTYEYIPDGEPYVFGGRLYVYGSHDRFNGESFCMNDYVTWSAPKEDLGDWRYEGVIYRKEQDPFWQPGNRMYAPDICIGPDGRYYLYYTLDVAGIMAVAAADGPTGPFEYYGRVRYADGTPVGEAPDDIFQFDPGLLRDDDGRIWLYSGFSPRVNETSKRRFGAHRMEGAYVMELEPDMLTVKSEPKWIIPGVSFAAGTAYEAHPFFEASSIRKINGKYFFVYSSIAGHELCYAVSDRPDGEFMPGGTIVSNGDIGLKDWAPEHAANYTGNNHGGMVEICGQWFIFYHRQTNYHSFSRQGCAEAIRILPDGSIPQVEMTSCGLNGGALKGCGTYPAAIACNLFSASGACFINQAGENREEHPVFTQSGADRECEECECDTYQYIAGMRKGATAGFKYFDLENTDRIQVEVRGAAGRMLIFDDVGGNGQTRFDEVDGGERTQFDDVGGKLIGEVSFGESTDWKWYEGKIKGKGTKSALFFVADTEGAVDFRAFKGI